VKLRQHPHPGARILELLGRYRITRRQLADHIGIGVERINRVVRGEAPLSHELALLLAQAFNTSPDFWVHQQAMYELAQTRIALDRRLSRIKQFPIPRPTSGRPSAFDRCLCGHFGWDHIMFPEGACIGAKEDGSACECPTYVRLGGYIATMGALKGMPEDFKRPAADGTTSNEGTGTKDSAAG
jgi:addiction module HigA family antidote